jgi:hypothetical protein
MTEFKTANEVYEITNKKQEQLATAYNERIRIELKEKQDEAFKECQRNIKENSERGLYYATCSAYLSENHRNVLKQMGYKVTYKKEHWGGYFDPMYEKYIVSWEKTLWEKIISWFQTNQ